MLKVAVTEHNEKLEEIFKSFPAHLLIVADELIQDLVRAGRVDVAIMPYSQTAERRFTHHSVMKFSDMMIVCSSALSSENKLIFEDFKLRLVSTYGAVNKYLLRMIASLDEADSVLRLLKASYLTDVFVVKSDTLARLETVTELAAYYDILTKLREAGARQISLIPIEKYY